MLILLAPRVALSNENPVYVESILDGLAESESSGKEILIIFTAGWCGACNVMKKDLANSSEILKKKIVCYIDYDSNLDLVKEYKVKIIPDYFILKNRKEIKRKKGYVSLENFRSWMNSNE